MVAIHIHILSVLRSPILVACLASISLCHSHPHPLQVGKNAFVLPDMAVNTGGAVVAIPANGESDVMWATDGSSSMSDSLTDYVDMRLRKWYHGLAFVFPLAVLCSGMA